MPKVRFEEIVVTQRNRKKVLAETQDGKCSYCLSALTSRVAKVRVSGTGVYSMMHVPCARAFKRSHEIQDKEDRRAKKARKERRRVIDGYKNRIDHARALMHEAVDDMEAATNAHIAHHLKKKGKPDTTAYDLAVLWKRFKKLHREFVATASAYGDRAGK